MFWPQQSVFQNQSCSLHSTPEPPQEQEENQGVLNLEGLSVSWPRAPGPACGLECGWACEQRALNLCGHMGGRGREGPAQHRPGWDLPTLAAFLPPNLFFFFLRKGLSLVWLVILSETELWKSPKLDGEQAPPPCPSSLTNLITIGLSSQFTGELEAQGTPSKLRIKFTCLSLWGVGNATDLYFTPPLVAQMVKNLPSMQETWVRCWVRKIPRRKKWQLTPVFLPGESHGQRTLAGYSSWGCKSDTTERLNHYHLTWLLCRIIFSPFFIFFSW